ncbi:MAG: GDP-L-fucose synthase [Elusimicrobia bacterium]|nr:GDP-L-fucose synthase [Elusimicrobiota bacterium]
MKNTDAIFVAGHRGLIGSAVVRRLKTKGHENIVIRDRARLDLSDPRQVDAFFEDVRPKYVILAAGYAGGILQNKTYPADFITRNLAIQLNVIDAAHESGVMQLVFFGSSCMYPRECPQPMNEDQLHTGKPEPTSMAYAMAKLAGVEMCLAYNRQYGEKRFLPVIPNNAYGPCDNFNPVSSHVLSALIRRMHDAKEQEQETLALWGTGSPRREFVYAEDVADACLHLLRSDLSRIEFPVNIGVGRDWAIRDIADIVRRTVGYQGLVEWDTAKPDGAPRKLLDSSRLLATGWKPKVSLEEGVQKTYDWLLNNPSEVRL